MSRTLVTLLSHQPASAVARMVAWWKSHLLNGDVVVAYGGTREEFDRLEGCEAYFVDDPVLRTRDHPRERQSYHGVMKGALPYIGKHQPEWVHLAEFDEVPVVERYDERLISLAEAERADVLGHELYEVEDSSNAHYLGHVGEQWFRDYWKAMSVRKDKRVVLSMLGCGTFWRAEAFAAVARLELPHRIYLELFLPTAAHHLGFRVRPIGMDREFVFPVPNKTDDDVRRLAGRGAWCVHPHKTFWMKDA